MAEEEHRGTEQTAAKNDAPAADAERESERRMGESLPDAGGDTSRPITDTAENLGESPGEVTNSGAEGDGTAAKNTDTSAATGSATGQGDAEGGDADNAASSSSTADSAAAHDATPPAKETEATEIPRSGSAATSSGSTSAAQPPTAQGPLPEEKRIRRRKRPEDSWFTFSLKSMWSIAAAILLLWGLHNFWTSWRLNAFCCAVQEAVNAPDGIEKLPQINDWRVREIEEGTLQVSRGDGAYTVYVWRLSGGGYFVDTIARRP